MTWTGSELVLDPAARSWQLGLPPPDSLPAQAQRTALAMGHEVVVWAGPSGGRAPVALPFTPPGRGS